MPSTDTHEFFSGFTEDIRIRLGKVMHLRSLREGESVFHQGEQADAIYIVLSGRIKISRVTVDGNESILCMRQKGSYFCPVPVLDQKSHLGTATAMGETEILYAERKEFLDICSQFPELMALVQGDCLAEVRHLLNRLETNAFRPIRERLALILLQEVSQLDASSEIPAVVAMTQQELSGLVGSSRESISRNLARFEEDGLVQTKRGRIEILDSEGLRQIVSRVKTR
ncbi:Crp/Fnr family transcriptional regulator [Chloroflexota bacterium]